jgi:hypothetical protein
MESVFIIEVASYLVRITYGEMALTAEIYNGVFEFVIEFNNFYLVGWMNQRQISMLERLVLDTIHEWNVFQIV